jgi:uncharacterized protein (DUF1015 family)
MAQIRPFQALRPQPEIASQLASPPYDVLNTEEAKAIASDNENSFLHVTKAEIDIPGITDLHGPEVYQKAKVNLEAMTSKGILFRDEKPCYYIYQLEMKGRSQTGLVCLSSVEDYDNNIIKKHEFTRPEKEKDRIDHMKTIKAQTGNVFMAYRDIMEVNALISGWKATQKPVYDFTAKDGIRHAVWVIDRELVINSITELFRTHVPATYIADGHHRAASAAKVSKAMPENQAAKYFLTTIFPASQLAIMDYNRVVRDLNGLTEEKLLGQLQDDFFLTLSPEPVRPGQLHEFGMYIDHQWYILTSRKGTYSNDPVGVLDITILSKNILSKLLGIKDQRTDKRIDFVGGIRGLEELEKRVNSGEMQVAFSLYPVTIDQLFAIADSGETMPPKSTWFEPKLRDGLLTHSLQ